MSTADRPIFVLRLKPQRGVDPIRSLRQALKTLLRRHGATFFAVLMKDASR